MTAWYSPVIAAIDSQWEQESVDRMEIGGCVDWSTRDRRHPGNALAAQLSSVRKTLWRG